MLSDLSTAPWFRRLLVAGSIVLGVACCTYVILQPFIIPVVWAGILAYVASANCTKKLQRFTRRPSIAALLTTMLLAVAIILPVLWLVLLLRVETVVAYREVQAFLASNPSSPALKDLPMAGPWLQQLLDKTFSTIITSSLICALFEQSRPRRNQRVDWRCGPQHRQAVLRVADAVLPVARRSPLLRSGRLGILGRGPTVSL